MFFYSHTLTLMSDVHLYCWGSYTEKCVFRTWCISPDLQCNTYCGQRF